ncbi:MAG: cytochrome P460 family protein [Pseudomonadota bacterium]
MMAKLFILLSATLIFGFAGLGTSAAQQESPELNDHIFLENPAQNAEAEAGKIYQSLKDEMEVSYEMSGIPEIKNYQSWDLFNSLPYLSETHGRRYVNNYANKVGANYGKLAKGEKHAPGTVLAKDSLTLTDNGQFFPGALFIMEKLAAGTNPQTADWRYIMISPDGSVFGDTTGDQRENVNYCHDCHKVRASYDYVFYIPEEFRRTE